MGGLGGGAGGEFLTPPKTRENYTYLISKRTAPSNLGSWGVVGDLWGLLYAFLHSHWKFLYATVLKRMVAKNLKRK
jgi:hypothetical protein